MHKLAPRRCRSGVAERWLVEIFALILPWLWIAAALVVMWLAGRSPRPGPPTVFALAMVMWGVSEFFVTPGAAPPWWLLAWKVACVATAGGSFLYLYASRLRQEADGRGRGRHGD